MLFVLPMLRFSKLFSLVAGACLFFSYMPTGPTQSSFSANLKAGYKGGTRLTFSEDTFDVVFILTEIQHSRLVRQGNDLYTTMYITSRQAKKGARLPFQHLDGTSIVLEIPPCTKTGHMIRLKDKGWPGRRNRKCGDLIIQIRIKPRRSRQRRWAL
jgi:DnaJ-class molecular chaperone